MLIKKIACLLFSFAALAGCATMPEPPQWNAITDVTEAEYVPYLKPGTGSVTARHLWRRGAVL